MYRLIYKVGLFSYCFDFHSYSTKYWRVRVYRVRWLMPWGLYLAEVVLSTWPCDLNWYTQRFTHKLAIHFVNHLFGPVRSSMVGILTMQRIDSFLLTEFYLHIWCYYSVLRFSTIDSGLTTYYAHMPSMPLSGASILGMILDDTCQIVCT